VVAPKSLRLIAEGFFSLGLLFCLLVPSAILSLAAASATLGVIAMMFWPLADWSREDRLMAFAPTVVALSMLWVVVMRTDSFDQRGLWIAAVLLSTPFIAVLARIMRFGWFPIVGMALLAAFAIEPVLLKVTALELGALPPIGLGVLMLIGIALLIGIPARQFAWGLQHRDLSTRGLALFGISCAVIAVPLLVLIADPGVSRPLLLAVNFTHWPLVALLLGTSWGVLRTREQELAESREHERAETLSVAIICKDEADRIGHLLESVQGWADEIVVLDSGSSDETVAIAKRFTAQVHETDWPGYGEQKRRAVEHCSCDWVLSLDADEVPTEALKREIDMELDGNSRCDAYRFPWVSIVFGGPVYFGADGRLHLRLFRRQGPAHFDDSAVHEGIVGAQRIRTLHGAVEHHTFRGAAHAARKFSEYAQIQAEERFRRGKRATRFGAQIRGTVSFVLLYIGRLGVLDGARGFRMALLYARYTRDKYAVLATLSQRASS
jgi:O-antigen ligase